jgi:beta-N-acetylhexosaminidase
MERRFPPDEGDDLFEWTEPPPRPPRDPDTGERERVGTGETERVESQPTRPEPRPRRAARGDTGEFERSGQPHPGRRERRRDLPARVRRRQDLMVGAGVAIVVIALIVLISGGGSSKAPPVPLKRLLGQTIVAKLGAKGPDQGLLQRVKAGQVGGVIAFPSDAAKLKSDVQQLQAAATSGQNPPLLVMIDQEGGPVKRLKAGPPDVSPADLGKSGDEAQSKEQGQKTGSYLRGLGVNVDLAPVLDVSQPQTATTIKSRTFGSDPTTVAKVGVPFAQGLQAGGVVATAKHFPGLGRATVNTDQHATSIAATSQQLQNDQLPFKAAVEAGVKMVMVSVASYPTLGASKPAVFSPTIVKDDLRGRLGFEGVVITDDLESPAVTGTLPPVVAAVSALQAGDDLLLYARNTTASGKVFAQLVKEVKTGRLSRSVVQAAYDRIRSLKYSPPSG